jgi:hypothetical protein
MSRFYFHLKFKKVTLPVKVEKETYQEAFREACRIADEWNAKGKEVLGVAVVE